MNFESFSACSTASLLIDSYINTVGLLSSIVIAISPADNLKFIGQLTVPVLWQAIYANANSGQFKSWNITTPPFIIPASKIAFEKRFASELSSEYVQAVFVSGEIIASLSANL